MSSLACSRVERVAGVLALACAVLCVATGATVLAGWRLGSETLVAVHRGYTPMQGNTALAFLLLGICLAAVFLEWKRTAIAGASLVLVMAALTLFEYTAGADLGIDHLVPHPVASGLYSGRMAPNTAVALLTASVSLLLLVWRARTSRCLDVAAALASCVTALGAVPLSGYALGLPNAFRWGTIMAMALPTACLFVAMGVGILASAWRNSVTDADRVPRWLPASVFLLCTSMSVLLAGALLNETHTQGLRDEARRSLGFATFLTVVLGVGTAAGLASVIRSAQRFSRRARELEELNRALDHEVEQRRHAQASTERLNRALRMVSECDHALAHATDENDLLQRICDLAVGSGGYRLAWIGLAEDDLRKSVRVAAAAGEARGYVEEDMVTWADEPRGRGPTGSSIRAAQPVCCDYTHSDPDFLPWRERAARFGLHSVLAVPLRHGGRAFGALSLYSQDENAFQHAEVELSVQLADDLAFGIDAMRNRAARDAAEKRIRFLASIVDSSDDAIYAQSLDGTILSWNRGAERLYGYTPGEMLGRNVTTLLPVGGQDDASEMLARLRAGENVERCETVRTCKDGREAHVSLTLSAVRAAATGIEAAATIARDITERKRAEAKLERYAADLMRSNEELQEFAFVASHDLQEPLRKITAFSERLRDRAEPHLDEVSRDYLVRMRSAAGRMSDLIDSLLAYSRVATRSQPFQEVDLAQLMLGVLADLEQRLRDSHAEVIVGILPKVLGDSTQLRQLLQNLLANALKFHAPNQPPRVAIRARPCGDRWEVSCADNGIGFDPAYTERIFRPFQRLHGRNEYEGSGMGLAICRKIAQRHGAGITVHSEPGKGATFTVSLPAIPERTSPCPEPSGELPFESSSPKMMMTTTC